MSEDSGVLGPSLFLPGVRLCNRSFGFGHTSGSAGRNSERAKESRMQTTERADETTRARTREASG